MSGGASEPPLPHVATVPLVSVVTAARDAEATVARALESLLAQTFRDWEAIVVDDGSSDGTAAVASEFLERDSRIRVLRRRPAGVSDARNAGVEAAKGRWLLFLDADDWLLPEALQRLTEVAAADPAAGVVHGGWVRFNNDGDVVDASAAARSGDLFDELARDRLFVIHACLVERDLVGAVGGFDREASPAEDWDLWQKVARTGARFAAVDAEVAAYRAAPGSASARARRMLEAELWVLERTHGEDPRVESPSQAHAAGRSRRDIAEARLDRLVRASGLTIAQGGDPSELLDLFADDELERLSPAAIAARLWEVLPNGLAQPLAGVVAAWPALQDRLDCFLSLLEERSRVSLLARRARRALEKLLVYSTELPRTDLGLVAGIRVDVNEPIPDARASSEVLICEAVSSHGPLGPVELPVCDGLVTRAVLRDALSVRHAWTLLEQFFGVSVYPQLERREVEGLVSVWRNGVRLGDLRPGAGLHEVVGWTVFLQELWGRSDWASARFHADGPEDGAPTLEVDTAVTLELAAELPNLDVSSPEVLVRATLGGASAAILAVPGGRIVGAHEVRRRVMTATGLELCRIAVREGVVGRPLGGPPLRDRLSTAASARATWRPSGDEALDDGALLEALAPRASGAVLARRAGFPIGTSVSRHAALPAAAWQELLEAARVAGEETYMVPPGETDPLCLVYSPEVTAGTAPDRAPSWEPERVTAQGPGRRQLSSSGVFRRRVHRGAIRLTRRRRLAESATRIGADSTPVSSWRLRVLTYHRIATGAPDWAGRFAVSPAQLEEQLRYLRDAGFRNCGLDEWQAAVAAGRPLPGRPILITFDDGYRDFLTDAWPLLQRYGFAATVFLVAGEIGGRARWDEQLGGGAPLLDWPEIDRLAAEGVEFGSHSMTHPPLTGLPPAEAVRELARSRAVLQERLGLPIRAFAYPYGDCDPALAHLVGACGYTHALALGDTPCNQRDSPLLLPRIQILSETSLERFGRTLE